MQGKKEKRRPSFLDITSIFKTQQNNHPKLLAPSFTTTESMVSYSDYTYFTSSSNTFQPTPIGLLWTILSIVLSGALIYCLLQPHWYSNPQTGDSFGPFGYCAVQTPGMTIAFSPAHQRRFGVGERLAVPSQLRCGTYRGHFLRSNVASRSWQASAALYSAGCMLECLASFIAIASSLPVSIQTVPCLKMVTSKKAVVIAGCFQAIAVMLLVLGLLLFPGGLGTPIAEYHCPNSSTYNTGDCDIGWAYMLAIMTTTLCIFCPVMCYYSDMQIHEHWWTSENEIPTKV